MKYLTVGTNEIKKSLFKKIENTDDSNIKPRGGLWLTKYENEYYNEWVDFLLDNPVVFYYKNKNGSLWNQPCSLVTLNDDAHIFILDNNLKFEYLKKNFPRENNNFSYEDLSNLYDGIFVDAYKLLCDTNERRFYKFGVNSLILFNLDCIKYYQSGIVKIEPFDYECGFCEDCNYLIEHENTKKKILKM